MILSAGLQETDMADVLKGNFELKNKVTTPEHKEELTEQFEREALKRLGGSIAFVSKKKFLYGLKKEGRPAKSDE
jgi:hypothetical protein